MCCHPMDMNLPDAEDPEFIAEGITVIQEEDEIAFPPPLVVEPTQEHLDELEERDDEIALEGEPV